jgi:hypothetical protein
MYAERAAFLDSLPRKFPNNGIYTVMGDFNIPIDPRRDAAQLHHRHDNGRAECLAWLAEMWVVDAWRWHNDESNKRALKGQRD